MNESQELKTPEDLINEQLPSSFHFFLTTRVTAYHIIKEDRHVRDHIKSEISLQVVLAENSIVSFIYGIVECVVGI